MADIAMRRVTLIKSKDGMAMKDYDAHWSGPHAAIAKDLPGLIWYVQNHVLKCLIPPKGRFGDVHGIAEISFEDPDKLFGDLTDWSRVGELRADEQVFLGDKFTFVTRVPSDLPELGQRRIIAILERSTDGSDDPDEDVLAKTVAALSAVGPAHLQMVANDANTPVYESESRLHALIFVELSSDTTTEILKPGGMILRQIEALGLPLSIYLVATEAKRLPIDLPD